MFYQLFELLYAMAWTDTVNNSWESKSPNIDLLCNLREIFLAVIDV